MIAPMALRDEKCCIRSQIAALLQNLQRGFPCPATECDQEVQCVRRHSEKGAIETHLEDFERRECAESGIGFGQPAPE